MSEKCQWLGRACCVLIALSCAFSHAQSSPRYALLNINNLSSWMRSDGQSSHSPKADDGTYFPRGTGSVIYQDGIMWGGKAYLDSVRTMPAPFNQLIRVGGSYYITGCRAGWIEGLGAAARAIDPGHPRARTYRIRRDYFFMSSAALLRDAAEFFELPLNTILSSQEYVQSIRAQYEKDWREWPVNLGAPFIDRNRNGKFDPPPAFSETFTPEDLIANNYDEPGIAGTTPDFPADQVLWTAYNDLDPNATLTLAGSEPLGLELQVTVWGYKSEGTLGNAFFRRARLINKGGVDIDAARNKGAFWIDSMYVGQWSDPDVGNVADDLVGCDTLLQLGYAYNANDPDEEFRHFQLPPPAVGYTLLQGPRVPAKGESAWFDFTEIANWKNVPMTAFAYGEPPCFVCDPAPITAQQWYRMLHGSPRLGDSPYFPFPPDLPPSYFPLSGDPVSRRDFIDGFGTDYSPKSYDRRFRISSGPFTLAPGDTQEIVIAFVAGLAADRLSSITAMKFHARRLRLWYPAMGKFVEARPEEREEFNPPSYYSLSPNYPNPFSSSTRIDYTLKREALVRLSIFDLMGREVAIVEERTMPAGYHRTSWNGLDQSNRALPGGVYFYRLRADYIVISRKLLLIR